MGSIQELLANLDPKLREELAAAAAAGQKESYPHIVSELPGAIKPNKPYMFRPYPKALTPPAVIVETRDREMELRAEWGTPLPYDGDASAESHRESYFLRQKYPKKMVPPQILVDSAEEERRVLASWQVGGADPVENQKWPQWRFHAEQTPVVVNDAAEAAALGAGWYLTPAEAVEVAQTQRNFHGASHSPVDEETERAALFRTAEENFVQVKRNWSTAKLREAVHGSRPETSAAA